MKACPGVAENLVGSALFEVKMRVDRMTICPFSNLFSCR